MALIDEIVALPGHLFEAALVLWLNRNAIEAGGNLPDAGVITKAKIRNGLENSTNGEVTISPVPFDAFLDQVGTGVSTIDNVVAAQRLYEQGLLTKADLKHMIGMA